MFCGKGGRERVGEESGGGGEREGDTRVLANRRKILLFYLSTVFSSFFFKGKKPYLYFTGNFFSFFQTRFLLSFTV